MGKEVTPEDIDVKEVQGDILDKTGGAVGLESVKYREEEKGNRVYLTRLAGREREIQKSLDQRNLTFEKDEEYGKHYLVRKS